MRCVSKSGLPTTYYCTTYLSTIQLVEIDDKSAPFLIQFRPSLLPDVQVGCQVSIIYLICSSRATILSWYKSHHQRPVLLLLPLLLLLLESLLGGRERNSNETKEIALNSAEHHRIFPCVGIPFSSAC